MKKLLLSMAALAMFSVAAMADTVTIPLTAEGTGLDNQTPWTTKTVDGVTLTGDVGTNPNNNVPTFYTSGNAVRFYGGNTLTVTTNIAGAKITEIVLNVSKNMVNGISAEVGECTNESRVFTWTDTAGQESVVLTFNNTSKNDQVQTVDVTYVLGEAPSVSKPAFSIAGGEVLKGTEVELTCKTEGADIYYTTNGDTPTNASYLYSDPIVINSDMTIKAIAYNGDAASDVVEATFTLVPVCNSIAALKELANKDKFTADFDATVVYNYGAYTYIYDGTDYTLIYVANKSLVLNPGDKIGPWNGSVSIYNNLFELVPNDVEAIEVLSTGNELPSPRELDIENFPDYFIAENQSDYVVIPNVNVIDGVATIADEDREYTVALYNRFGLDAIENGTYDITGFIAVYKDTVQLYYTSVDTNPTGVNELGVDLNAPAQYFNLQGMKVANPVNGIYVKLQNGKATKVVVK